MMNEPVIEPEPNHMRAEKFSEIVAPFAWKGADLQHSSEWIRPFSADELEEIDSALQAVKRRGLE